MYMKAVKTKWPTRYASGCEFLDMTFSSRFTSIRRVKERHTWQAAAISAMQIEPKTDPNPQLFATPLPPFLHSTRLVNNNFKILVSARLSNAIWHFIERASDFYVNF